MTLWYNLMLTGLKINQYSSSINNISSSSNGDGGIVHWTGEINNDNGNNNNIITETTDDDDIDQHMPFTDVSLLFRVFITLSICYGLLALVPLIQLIRIKMVGFPLRRVTTQKTFLLLLLLTCIFRTIFFTTIVLTSQEEHERQQQETTFDLGRFNQEYLTILDDTGCITFFTTFCLLILFWIEIVYHSRNKSQQYKSKVRPLFFIATLFIYIIQIAIWIVIKSIPTQYRDLMDKIDNTFYSTISSIAGFGFLYYGIVLSMKLIRNPINSPGKKRKLVEVISFTILCTVCFFSRSLLFILISYYKGFNVNGITVAVYYGVSEILPSIFVVILFRKLPPRVAVTPTYRINYQNSTIRPDYFPPLSNDGNENNDSGSIQNNNNHHQNIDSFQQQNQPPLHHEISIDSSTLQPPPSMIILDNPTLDTNNNTNNNNNNNNNNNQQPIKKHKKNKLKSLVGKSKSKKVSKEEKKSLLK